MNERQTPAGLGWAMRAGRGCIAAVMMATVGFAPGCQYLKVITFEKAPGSGVETKQHVKLFRVGGTFDQETPPPFEIVQKGLPAEALQYSISQCYATGLLPAGAAVPIAVAAGQYLFGQLLDALAEKAELLQKRAQRTYDAKALVEGRVFEDKNVEECLFFVRYGKEAIDTKKPDIVEIDDIGLAVLFRKQAVGKGLIFQPYFLWLANSVAITDKESSKINLSVALAAKGYDRSEVDFRARSLGEASYSIEAVPIQPDKPQLDCGFYKPADKANEKYIAVCDNKRFLGPFDIPHSDATGGLISVAVTETGSPAKAGDKAKAEAEALNKTFGSAIGKVIETLLTPAKK